jgi:hypothetical protein
MRTITAMFDSRAEAETARDRLSGAGISPDQVTIYDKSALGQDDRNVTPLAKQSSSFMTHTSNEPGSGVSQGQPPEGAADGSEGVHRGVLGDFIDDRTGTKIGADAGSDSNALGDFVDANGERRGDHGADNGDSDHNSRSRGESDTGLWASIKHFFQGDDHIYEEGMRRGSFLLSARVDDSAAEQATTILMQNANVDLDERQASWRLEGWSGSASNRAAPADAGTGTDAGLGTHAGSGLAAGSISGSAAGSGRIRSYQTNDQQGF